MGGPRIDWKDLVERAHVFVLSTPEGFTMPQLAAHLGETYDHTWGTVSRLRRKLREEPYALVCEPRSKGEPWLYRIAVTPEGAKTWTLIRQKVALAQLDNVRGAAMSLVNGAPPTSFEGAQARLVLRELDRLVEDIQALGVELQLTA